jgi:hypothetical protein
MKQALEPSLQAAGSSLEQSLKARAYIRGVENFPEFMDVWQQYFHDIPCAITPVPAKNYASSEGMIEINLIALKIGSSPKKEVVGRRLGAFAGKNLRWRLVLLTPGVVAGTQFIEGNEGRPLLSRGCTLRRASKERARQKSSGVAARRSDIGDIKRYRLWLLVTWRMTLLDDLSNFEICLVLVDCNCEVFHHWHL